MSLTYDKQAQATRGAPCPADAEHADAEHAATDETPQGTSAIPPACHTSSPACHTPTPSDQAALPSCHTSKPSSQAAPPSCHSPAASTRRDGLILLFGALAAAFGWVIWLLPDSSPLNQDWLLGALSTAVIWGTGWPILRAGWTSIPARSPNMNTLISLGVLVAWGWSIWATTADNGGDIHFTMASTIIVFVRLGGWLESRAQTRSQDAVASLAKLSVTTARLEDGTDIPIEDLAVGMRFLVRPGERVATDGIVVSGHSAVDKSFLTGEPIPVAVQPGDEVTGATLNTSGLLVVETQRVGAETAHAQIMRLLEEAEQSRAPVQRLVDRASAVFVPAVIAAALVTFIGWMLVGGEGASAGLAAGVAVLVVACPCALGLATPTAIVAGVGRAAREGIIIRSGNVWEAARRIDTAVVDKTGTLTYGHPSVQKIVVSDLAGSLLGRENLPREKNPTQAGDPEQTQDTEQEGEATQEEVLEVAAALAEKSLHPLSQAIARKRSPLLAKSGVDEEEESEEKQAQSIHMAKNGNLEAASEQAFHFRNFAETPGAGVVAELSDGSDAALGSSSLFSEIPNRLAEAASSAAAKGFASVFVGWGDVDQIPPVAQPPAKGLIICADELRDEANKSVADMQSLGISVIMATGDSEASALHVAEQVKPDRVVAECLPQDKLAEVARLQETNHTIAMIGDGINDAAALAKADVGIALSDGADVAAEASDITVIGGDLGKAVKAIEIARATSSTILANLVWACVYNAALLPLAAAGVMPPVAAAGAMSLSSLCVVGNSLRLARRRLN